MMRRYRGIGVFGALASTALVIGLIASGCGSTDCSFTATCVGATVGGNEGGSDVAMVDGGFDAPLDPCVNTPNDPKCLDETTALFVSAKADAASADGSRAHPFKTITAGLAAVSAARKRVYVCEGDYVENVSVQTTVSLLGGLTCDWMGKKAANPRIAPPKGVALSILKSDGVVVTDVNVEGTADAQVDGDSAIAIFVSNSNSTLLRRVTATAGSGTKGAAGLDGETAPNYAGLIATAGVTTSSASGAAAPVCGTCVDGTSSTAGKGGTSGGAGPDPGGATPAVGGDNSGGTVMGNCVAGGPGAPGLAAVAAAAASAPGTLKATGWESATSAKKGTNGNPAQGGGGAGNNNAPALGGGSGGCGGCGGSGGGAGGNGGSSFALLTFSSDVSVEDSTLTAGTGGTGGKGGKGQDGQFRGPAGGGACNGGDGGHGAGGGGGGGGAGGDSAAIAYVGKAPTQTNTMLKHGTEGPSGDGGGGGASTGNPGKAGDKGAKGSAADVLPF
jgi:hypothetical protein